MRAPLFLVLAGCSPVLAHVDTGPVPDTDLPDEPVLDAMLVESIEVYGAFRLDPREAGRILPWGQGVIDGAIGRPGVSVVFVGVEGGACTAHLQPRTDGPWSAQRRTWGEWRTLHGSEVWVENEALGLRPGVDWRVQAECLRVDVGAGPMSAHEAVLALDLVVAATPVGLPAPDQGVEAYVSVGDRVEIGPRVLPWRVDDDGVLERTIRLDKVPEARPADAGVLQHALFDVQVGPIDL